MFQSIERESVLPECATRVSGKSVSQECPIKVSHKSAPQEYATRVSQKTVPHDCPRRVSGKSVLQEWLLMRSSISCSLFIVLQEPFFYVSFEKMHSGSWLLSVFFFTTGQNDVARASTSFMFSSRSQVLMHRCQFSRVSSSFLCLYLDVVAVVSLLDV